LDVLLAGTLEAAVMTGKEFSFTVSSQLMNLKLVNSVQQLTAVITLHARHPTAHHTTPHPYTIYGFSKSMA